MSLRIDPARTALLVIDMQNAFCSPQGTLAIDGSDTTAMQACVPRVQRLVETARQAGIPDIWTIQEHLRDDRTREAHLIIPHTRKRVRPPALQGTWDAEIVEDLQPLLQDATHVIRKHRFGCFYNTSLEVLLRAVGAQILLISGVATNVCVETTAREAYMRDFDVVMVSDAVASWDQAFHENTLRMVNRYLGLTMTVDEVADAVALANTGRK